LKQNNLSSPSKSYKKERVSQGAVLSKEEIIRALSNRDIVVEPILDHRQINHVSIDLRLDTFFGEFRTARKSHIDPAKIKEDYRDYLEFIVIEPMYDVYYLQPKQFVLAQTFEYIALPNDVTGNLEGKSSVARGGLTVQAAAGLVDPGFTGHLVFELLNAGQMPLKLCPLMKIAKISFQRCTKTKGYKGTYRMQVKIRQPENDNDVASIDEVKTSRSALALKKQELWETNLRASYSG